MRGRQVQFQHGDSGDNLAIQRGCFEGITHIGAANRVEDDVEAGPAGMLGHIIGDRFGLVVDRRGAIAVDHARLPITRAGGVDVSTQVLGQLHGNMANTARTTMHQYALSGVGAGALQTFVGGNTHQWQGCCLTHRKRFRFVSYQLGVGQHVLSQRTLQVGQAPGATVDLVTRRKTADAFADCLNGAGEIHAQYGGQGGGERQVLTHLADHGIDRIDTGRRHADHHVPGLHRGLRQFSHLELGSFAIFIEGHGFH